MRVGALRAAYRDLLAKYNSTTDTKTRLKLLGDIQKKITEGSNAGNSTEQQAILNSDL